jgi:hypothetical protein
LNLSLYGFGRALDEGGCLTCHRYPGLVRPEKDGGIKALHIDETRFYQSTHGNFKCQQCHPDIEKVPHTGEIQVDCLSSCHSNDELTILLDDYPLQGFHQEEHAYITRLQDPSSCNACHSTYPHSRNKLVRAFLNMHTGFMLCEVCHINRKQFQHLDYAWYQPEHAEFKGQPFGSYFRSEIEKTIDSTRSITRIAVFDASAGSKRLLHHTRDRQKAEAFKQHADSQERDVIKDQLEYFHRNIQKKSVALACEECHTVDSILDFKKLGFDQVKINRITLLNLKGLVTKYENFYLPKMFDPIR